MDTQSIGDAIQDALKAKFPNVELYGERFSRELFAIDFKDGPDSGTITIEVEPEELACINCSGMMSGAENLVPVTDGEVFDVACIHNLPNLRNWRKLTENERKEFDAGSENLIKLLEEHGKKGDNG